MDQVHLEGAGPECRFGPIELGDLDPVMDIELGGHAYPWTKAVFRDCFKPGYQRWGVWSEGELKGFAILCWQFDELHLLNLCVRRNSHRQGLGRRLLKFAIAKAAAEAARCVLLEVRVSNNGAVELYRKEGFVEVGRRRGYYPAGRAREDALVMTLSLTGALSSG